MQLVELFQIRLDEHKIHLTDALKPYKNDPSIYITFSNIEKVGINPQSEYDTPLGIYTYPLDAMWDLIMFNNIPFGGERSYIHVLKSVGNVLDLRKYDDGHFERDCEKLHQIFLNGKFAQKRDAQVKDKIMKKWRDREADFDANGGEKRVDDFIAKQKNQLWNMKVEEAKRSAFVGTPGGWIWNLTRLLALFDGADPRSGGKPPVIWNSIFRQLGYDGVVDRHDEGIIHKNEPTQAVFFSKSALRHIETIANNRERPHDVERQITFSNYMDFYNWIDGFNYHEYEGKDAENQKKDTEKWLSLLKHQWAQLMKTGESQNFILGVSKEEFDREMVELPRAFIRKMLDASPMMTPIVISEMLQHPEMQTKEAWHAFIAHFNSTKSKILRILLLPAVITLHAKINDWTYEDAWASLSEKVLQHLLYTNDIMELLKYNPYPKTYEDHYTQKVNKRFGIKGAITSKDMHPAWIQAKQLIKPLLKYLDPSTVTDEALTKTLEEIEKKNEMPF